MAAGCTNPAAKNYDPSATEDDGSCVYLTELNGQCLEFGDAEVQDTIEDKSFTLSYDTVDKGWAFFHDYFPDYYIHTRKNLFTLKKGNRIYEHNEGPRGSYYDANTYPFILDVLFANKETLVLNSVNWISEVRETGNKESDERSAALYDQTVSAITIWNNYECTDRIILNKENLTLLPSNNRNSEQTWSFNDFRNIANEDVQFLDTIFKNFALLPNAVNRNLPWYNQRLMDGKYFIVRFEFENVNDRQITLHDMNISVDQSFR